MGGEDDGQPPTQTALLAGAETGRGKGAAPLRRVKPGASWRGFAVHPSITPTTRTPGTRSRAFVPFRLSLLEFFGGRQEARTPDLGVANAALSQLS
jgi:hypothetical protein